MKPVLTVLLLAALLSACADDPPPKVEPEPPREAPSTPPPAVIEPTEEEVPIPEDFEEEAEKEVSPNDLGAQLDAIEQEIASDGK
jgi:PBP1b-binding outer membrane lipoprotein LpoB